MGAVRVCSVRRALRLHNHAGLSNDSLRPQWGQRGKPLMPVVDGIHTHRSQIPLRRCNRRMAEQPGRSPARTRSTTTVNDSKNWIAPWTLRMPIPREDSYGFYEYTCHEGNYAMTNLLSGSRAEERRRAEAAARGAALPIAQPAGGRGGRGGGSGGGGRGGGAPQ